jgi:drug/metabolite transporter (DMT)-like permease
LKGIELVKLKDHPLALLLATGGLLGLLFPIGKLASAEGIPPIAWAAMMSLVPGIAFALVLVARRDVQLSMQMAGFSLVSGFLSQVLPNATAFAAIPKIGSGLSAMMFALSPIFTATVAIIFRVRPPDRRLLAGVVCGFAGAVLIALARHQMQLGVATIWLFIAFLIPVSLGFGNNFRTAFWPKQMTPLGMAAWTNIFAGLVLVAVSLLVEGVEGFLKIASSPALAVLQCVVSALNFLALFRLQWVGGPTYLSQIGYVAAAVALTIGVAFFGERYPPFVWAGAVAIVCGITIANWPQKSRT